MSPVLMRGDLKLSRYVWQATSQMSLDHRILYPCRCSARSDPPHPLNSEIAVGFIPLPCLRPIVQWKTEFAKIYVFVVTRLGKGGASGISCVRECDRS